MKNLIPFLILLFFPLITFADNIYTINEQWVDCANGIKLLDTYYRNGVIFTWDGPSKDGKADGNGIAIKYINGNLESTYVGEYKDGIKEGKGEETKNDGTVFKGTFKGGQFIGHGTMDYENGRHYEGEIINYRAHGQGKGRWGNGSSFEGFWVGGSPYTGKYTNYDGTTILLQKGEPVEKINEKKSNYSPKIGTKITEYFDKDWQRCDAKNAEYYRIITYEAPHKPKGTVKDFYMNGKMQGEATFVYVDYDDEGKNFQEGKMTNYYPSGKLESEMYFLNNKPNGPSTTYYENGKTKSEMFFKDGELDGDLMTYYENGIPSTIGIYENGVLKNNKYLQFSQDAESCFLIYKENFERNRKHWEYQGANGTIKVNNRNLATFTVTPDRSVSGGIFADFSPTGDNIIKISTRKNNLYDDVVIGFLFGYKDWENYCGFYIARNQYTFVQYKNGKQVTDDDFEYSDAINPDINTLRILNVGNQVGFEINGQEIGAIKRPRYDGSLCVLTVINDNSYLEAVVDAGDLQIIEVVEDLNDVAQYLPNNTRSQNNGDWKASGSGFFITEDGLLATNYHVVEGMNDIEVTFIREGQKESYPASVVLSDKQNDLSILKIDSPNFRSMPEIPYNFNTHIKDTGSEVFTLGYPIASVMGEEVKFTDGKISSKTGIQGDVTVYQISVPIQHGNSGGPLFDNQGNVVGITSSGLNRDYYRAENVNYAIKSSYLKALIDALPQNVELQMHANISDLPLIEKIKRIQPYMIYIKVK